MRALIASLNHNVHTLAAGEQATAIPALLDLFVPEPDAQKAVLELLIDYVFNLCLAMAKSALLSSSPGSPEKVCYAAVFQAFRLDESAARRLSHLALQAAREANRARESYSNSQQVNEDYCYLCGKEFADSERAATTVDHVWPKRAAGTKKKSNLFRCHDRCEIPKWDTVGAGDVASLRFAFKESTALLHGPVDSDWFGCPTTKKADLLRLLQSMRFAQLRIGVAARQRYKCGECERSFLDETRGINIVRRENAVPWAYTNTIAICDECHMKRGIHHA